MTRSCGDRFFGTFEWHGGESVPHLEHTEPVKLDSRRSGVASAAEAGATEMAWIAEAVAVALEEVSPTRDKGDGTGKQRPRLLPKPPANELLPRRLKFAPGSGGRSR